MIIAAAAIQPVVIFGAHPRHLKNQCSIRRDANRLQVVVLPMSPEPIVALPAFDAVTTRPRPHLIVTFQTLDFFSFSGADEEIGQLGAQNADAVQETRLLADLETNSVVIILEVFDGD